jgi:hypothetical protein
MLVATFGAVGISMIGTLPLALKTLRQRALEGLQDLRAADPATVSNVAKLLVIKNHSHDWLRSAPLVPAPASD